MKYCVKCGTVLQDEVNFCSYCGASQQHVVAAPTPVTKAPQDNSSALTTLCILTIIGSVFGILKGLFYESITSFSSDFMGGSFSLMGYFAAMASVGTLTGAILMLNRKKAGYTVYVIAQVAGILLSILRTVQFTSPFHSNDNYLHAQHTFNVFSVFLGAFFTLPSIVFLILYTTLVRKHLQ